MVKRSGVVMWTAEEGYLPRQCCRRTANHQCCWHHTGIASRRCCCSLLLDDDSWLDPIVLPFRAVMRWVRYREAPESKS